MRERDMKVDEVGIRVRIKGCWARKKNMAFVYTDTFWKIWKIVLDQGTNLLIVSASTLSFGMSFVSLGPSSGFPTARPPSRRQFPFGHL